MALVSGRSIAALDRIFAPARFPAAGAHGTEFRTTGDAPADSGALALPAGVMDRLEAFVRQRDGLLLEAKAGGASLHYRQAPEREHEARAFVDSLLSVISADYRLIDGKMVLELAPRHHDKGEAIRTLLAAAPFSGRRPVFVGDDVTDEDGFNAVNELGGTSIHVGEQMNTAARCRLADVAAVRAWLRDSAGRDPAGQQHS
jgi:trehalose 6-phosphate phosphatase